MQWALEFFGANPVWYAVALGVFLAIALIFFFVVITYIDYKLEVRLQRKLDRDY